MKLSKRSAQILLSMNTHGRHVVHGRMLSILVITRTGTKARHQDITIAMFLNTDKYRGPESTRSTWNSSTLLVGMQNDTGNFGKQFSSFL